MKTGVAQPTETKDLVEGDVQAIGRYRRNARR